MFFKCKLYRSLGWLQGTYRSKACKMFAGSAYGYDLLMAGILSTVFKVYIVYSRLRLFCSVEMILYSWLRLYLQFIAIMVYSWLLVYCTVYCTFGVQLIAGLLTVQFIASWRTVDCEFTVQSIADRPNNVHDLNVIMLYSKLQIYCAIKCI